MAEAGAARPRRARSRAADRRRHAQPARAAERAQRAADDGAGRGASRELDDDGDVRCIVLTGSEKAFAAGADIGELASVVGDRPLRVEARRPLGRAARRPDAARRGRVRLLPRRRLRAGDGLRR